MQVKDVMRGGVETIPSSASWKEAATFMLARRVSAVPVTDPTGKLVGILSEKDLFHGLFPAYRDWIREPHAYYDLEKVENDVRTASGRTVAELMSTRLITATPDTPILKVGAHMVASGIHQVPVLENGALVGMVGRGDMYRAILQTYFGLNK